MKHLFLAVFSFAAITGSTAQTLEIGRVPSQRVRTVPLSITPADIVGRSTSTKPADGNTQGAAWQTLFSTNFRTLFYYSTSNIAPTVIEYDAPSNSLSLVRTQPEFVASTLISKLGVMRSNDNGANWTYDIVKDMPAGFIGFPNMAQIRNGSNPATWPVFLYGYTYDGTGNTTRYYTAMYRINGNTSDIAFTSNVPGQNNYTWGQVDLGVDKENEGIVAAARLGVVENAGAQYGAYGFFNFLPAADDFLVNEVVPAWYTNKFRQVSPANPNSTLGTMPLLDTDADGRIYVAFNNILLDSNSRTILVSTSEDGGQSWSQDFNMMPPSLFSDLAATLGTDVVSLQRPYEGGCFIVTGPNEYSYFFTVAAGPLSPPGNTQGTFNIAAHLILEARFKAGVWSLSVVKGLNLGLSLEGAVLDYPEFFINNDRNLQVGASTRSIELEAAITADGNSLLLKYLDQDSVKITPINPPIPYYKQEFNQGTGQWETIPALEPLDTLIVTDVYMTYRDLNGDVWSQTNNVSNDLEWNRGTFMPRQIPSLSNVPLIQVHGTPFGDTAAAGFPPALIQAMSDQAGEIQYVSVDAATVGVEDERTYDFRINNIMPNPSTHTADVTFTLDKGAVVTADLYDVLGNKVRSLIGSTFVSSGPHGVLVDVNTLSAGQYYVALTVGGNRITRSLVVVK